MSLEVGGVKEVVEVERVELWYRINIWMIVWSVGWVDGLKQDTCPG